MSSYRLQHKASPIAHYFNYGILGGYNTKPYSTLFWVCDPSGYNSKPFCALIGVCDPSGVTTSSKQSNAYDS
eukprot:1316277-Amorphochlora_amoeboformis.AAC.2